jgi:serine/threonine protein kinase
MFCDYTITPDVVGFGKDSNIVLAEKDKKKYALKIFKAPNAIYNPIEVDIQFKLKDDYLLKGEDIIVPGQCDLQAPGIVSKYYPIRLKDTLKDLSLSYKEKKKIMIDLAKGMKTLHKNNYLYLDCKVENCVLEKKKEGYNGVLIDFGLSSFAPKGIEDGIMTLQRRIDPLYTPPECIKLHEEGYFYNNKSDIWCLGVTYLLMLIDNEEYLPSYLVKDTTFPDFTDLADFYLCNLTEENIVKYMEENIVPKIRHFEIKNPEERKNMLGLLMKMIRINAKKRITIDEVINDPCFRGEDKNDKSKKEAIKNISLQEVQFDYYIGIYNIIEYLQEHFEKECIGIFFMTLDIYLRNIYELTINFEDFEYESMENLAKNCCLIAFKYYNWSELKNYPPNLSKKLYSEEFAKDEAIIYKRIDGKINEERYFSNAKNMKELKEIYKFFIQKKKNPDDNIEFINDFTRYVINGNIIDYLNKDGKEFIDRFDIRGKNDIFKIKIRDFFLN